MQFDRRAISVQAGLFAAIPVVAVLAIGTVAWSAVAGVTMGAGAMLVGVAWRVSGGRPPIAVLAIDASLMSLSTFVGSVTGSVAWLHFAVLCVWALTGGLLVALGNRGGAVGTQSIIAFVVFGRFSQPAGAAFGLATLVLAGGFAQVLFQSIVRWPTPLRVQRHATADAYRALSRLATASAESSTLPAANALDEAQATLSSPTLFGDPALLTLRSLVAEGKRMRVGLSAIHSLVRTPADRRTGRRRRPCRSAGSGRRADPRADCRGARSGRARDRGRPRRRLGAPQAHGEAELGHRRACTDAGRVRVVAVPAAGRPGRAAPRDRGAGGKRRRGQRAARPPPPCAHKPPDRAVQGRRSGAPRQRQPRLAGGSSRAAAGGRGAARRVDLAPPAAQPQLLDGRGGRDHAAAGVRRHVHPRRRARRRDRARRRPGGSDRGRAASGRGRDRGPRRRARVGRLRAVPRELRGRLRVHHRGGGVPAERGQSRHARDGLGASARHARRRHAWPARLRAVADVVRDVRAQILGGSGRGPASVRAGHAEGDRRGPAARRRRDPRAQPAGPSYPDRRRGDRRAVSVRAGDAPDRRRAEPGDARRDATADPGRPRSAARRPGGAEPAAGARARAARHRSRRAPGERRHDRAGRRR